MQRSRGSNRELEIPKDKVMTVSAAIFVLLFGASTALGAVRDVQIRNVDFTNQTLELYNFGVSDESLAGWRFCSHDEDQIRRYSSVTGFNGVTIEAGTSITIYYNNDSPGGADHLNRSTLGGNFALPLDYDAYAIGLYWGAGFGTGSNIADHIQWSDGGADNASADERSDEAESGGVWVDQSVWVATTEETLSIDLTDLTGGVLHSPANYQVNEPAPPALPSFGAFGALALLTGLVGTGLAKMRS